MNNATGGYESSESVKHAKRPHWTEEGRAARAGKSRAQEMIGK